MTGLRTKTREVGATATVGRAGAPSVASRTDGRLDLATGVADPGFNPLDLLFSSLASCLVLSARIAASRLQMLERFGRAEVRVTGEKNDEEPYRIRRLLVEFHLEGEFTPAEKQKIIHLAEEICTISNTLKTPPELLLRTD